MGGKKGIDNVKLSIPQCNVENYQHLQLAKASQHWLITGEGSKKWWYIWEEKNTKLVGDQEKIICTADSALGSWCKVLYKYGIIIIIFSEEYLVFQCLKYN